MELDRDETIKVLDGLVETELAGSVRCTEGPRRVARGARAHDDPL